MNLQRWLCGLLVLAMSGVHSSWAGDASSEWSAPGGDESERHFSTLQEINAANVAQLKLAWHFEVPDGVSLTSTPLMVGRTLYFSADRGIVHALDATSGAHRWTFDPQAWKHSPRGIAFGFNTNRGIAYWQGHIYVGAADGRLIALDAATGSVQWASRVFPIGEHQAINSAPRAFDGKVFIGTSGAEFGSRGQVAAFDAVSGDLLWRFYTVPGNPADGFENAAMAMAAKTWHGDWWKRFGGGTVWHGMAYDPDLDLLYIGVGNGDPWDHQLRSEGKGDNLFLCSIVALKAGTGEYVWHYQLNPGEQWDYKATADMMLGEIKHQGATRKVLMQAPTNGFFYVLDRVTGELLSAEKYDKVTWADRIDLRTGRPVEAPGVRMKPGEKTLIYPSPFGAHNWQATSMHPGAGLVYIPTIRLGALYSRNMDFKFRDNFFTIPIVTEYVNDSPDDGTGGLVAWDPETQSARWRIQYDSLWNSGVLATGGNLVFHATALGAFNAYQADTGEKLWQFDVQRGVNAAPMSYAVDGKQFIALPVGWGGMASFGLEAFQHGWRYKEDVRMLAFALDGTAALPPPIGRRGRFNPVDLGDTVIDATQAGRGFEVYHQASCATCHGGMAVSTGAAGPDLRESSMLTSYSAFRAVVAEGALLHKSMPVFDDLSETELKSVFEYVRSEARKAEGE